MNVSDGSMSSGEKVYELTVKKPSDVGVSNDFRQEFAKADWMEHKKIKIPTSQFLKPLIRFS